MTVNLKEVESKWQRIWEEKKVYQPEPDERSKFFITVPYPYLNGLLHLGSAFTYSRGDFLARYKRMKGYNVLWPQGWHITGAPIVGNALRLKEGDPKIIKDLELQKIPKEDWEKLKTPEGWALYFVEKNREAFKKFGFSIDWRREFYTTYLNEPYSKFIHWQYRKLMQKGLIIKGEHPVVWDPKVEKVIGDHDRPDEYITVQITEGYVIRFYWVPSEENPLNKVYEEYKKPIVFPCFTLRPETVYGVTNIWINPNVEYIIAEVNGELWIIPDTIVKEELKAQNYSLKEVTRVSPDDIILQTVRNPVTNEEIPVLPANFVNPEIGTGIVMSVPAHAPYDYIALIDLTKEGIREDIRKEAENCLKRMTSLFEVEGFSEFPAKDACEKFGVKSQEDRELLDKATEYVYSKEFYTGKLKNIYGKHAGKTIQEVKDTIANEFIEKGIALKYYTLPVRFKSRYGGICIVKIVKDQWFIKYSDPEWKKLAHECIDQMRFLPEEVRNNFHYTVDWLKDWACVHQRELGTPWPWDPEWTIESLSDSTIYMAYYIIAKYLQHPEEYGIDIEKIDDSFFDYVFLGEGDPEEISRKIGIKKELLEQMRKEFEYWYPVDIRTSAKELIQNHLTFFIFHHVAIFPKKYWPKGIAINGWVLMDGRKMSKSLGNVIPMLYAVEEHSVDALRFLLAYAGEIGLDDANLEYSRTNEVENELKSWYEFAIENYGKGRENKLLIDDWFENVLRKYVKEADELYDQMRFKTLINRVWYDLEREFKWYLKRTNNNPNKEVLSKYIKFRTLLIYPIIPHLASEILEKINEDPLNPKWPEIEEINEEILEIEDYIKSLRDDILRIIDLLKKRGRNITEIKIILASKQKYDMVSEFKEMLNKNIPLNEIVRELCKKYPEYSKLIPKLSKDLSLVKKYLPRDLELRAINEAKDFLENEFSAKITIELEEDSKEDKAKQALPKKPAIVVS